MGKSAGVDNIPAELVQADGETIIDVLTEICDRIWRTGEWATPWYLGKSAEVDNIPAELVQAGGDTMIDVLINGDL